MAYMHIDNLYKNQEIMLFKECFALEKIHGTSSNVAWKDKELKYHPGGVSQEQFTTIFDSEALIEKAKATGLEDFTVYGEAYGGKMQRMSGTYGKSLKFICFEVRVGECWLSVPQAEEFCKEFGLEFVSYERISTDIKEIDRMRDMPSVQAVRNGCCDTPKKREGVVLRPIIEVTKNNGERIIAKHKGEGFSETKTKREMDPAKLKVLSDAKDVSEEWVTPTRLNHVLDKIEEPGMEKMRDIIRAMQEDVKREGEGEIIWSKAVEKAIGKTTANMTKQHFQSKLHEE